MVHRFDTMRLGTWAWVASVVLGLSAAVWAAPPAGSQIGNQATATYKDANGVEYTVASNIVYVTVQQIAALQLTPGQLRPAQPGSPVTWPHTITNTGNGADTFTLARTQPTTDDFNVQNLSFYPDVDGNGIPDSNTEITSTGPVPAGGSVNIVVQANVPNAATDGQRANVDVEVTSGLNNTVKANATDVVVVRTGATMTATKSVNTPSGPSPSGPYTFTITYSNTGVQAATNVQIVDPVPAGLTYAAGSGRWSVSGGTPLTDAAGGDPAGIEYDFGATAPGTLTATLASVAPGASGTITFDVTIAAGVAAGPIANSADLRYSDGVTNHQIATNRAVFTVTTNAVMTFVGETVPSANQGATVDFHNVVTNQGNRTDTYDVTVLSGATFPFGTNLVLYQSDGRTQLLDSDGDGVPDTGPVAAGGTYTVILRAFLPPGSSGNGPYTAQKKATSSNDTNVTATATDTLTQIIPSTVDVTNDLSVAGGATGANGLGAGPEAGPVTTQTGNPGDTVRFTLHVNNTSASPNTFNLAASNDPNFGSTTLASGVTVQFKTVGGSVISNTGVILGNASLQVNAEVALPSTMPAGLYHVYFRAQSPTTGTADRKHDAVNVATTRALTLVPDNVGQVSPGGSVVYTHTITNHGNVLEGDGTASAVALSSSNNVAGFTSVIYWDKNNNGVLDATDVIVADLAALVGGTNGASTAAGLDPGESATLFQVVFAAPSLPVGKTDLATLVALASQGTYATAPPPAVRARDTTTVIPGDIVMLKKQALDADQNGTPDGAYVETNLSTGAIPGACIRYELTVTNNGTTPISNLVVMDRVPTFTGYHAGDGTTSATGVASWTVVGSGSFAACTAPAAGATGDIVATIGALQPGQSAKITFGVRIDP